MQFVVLGGQTCLLCGDENGARGEGGTRRRWVAAVVVSRRASSAWFIDRRGSHERAQCHYVDGGGGYAYTSRHAPRAIHMGPPIIAKGVVSDYPNLDLKEKLSQHLCNTHSFT